LKKSNKLKFYKLQLQISAEAIMVLTNSMLPLNFRKIGDFNPPPKFCIFEKKIRQAIFGVRQLSNSSGRDVSMSIRGMISAYRNHVTHD